MRTIQLTMTPGVEIWAEEHEAFAVLDTIQTFQFFLISSSGFAALANQIKNDQGETGVIGKLEGGIKLTDLNFTANELDKLANNWDFSRRLQFWDIYHSHNQQTTIVMNGTELMTGESFPAFSIQGNQFIQVNPMPYSRIWVAVEGNVITMMLPSEY